MHIKLINNTGTDEEKNKRQLHIYIKLVKHTKNVLKLI